MSSQKEPVRAAGESWVAKYWAAAIQSVLEAMVQAKPEVTHSRVNREDVQIEGEWTWWASTMSNAPHPAIWVGATTDSWAAIGRHILSSLGITDESPEDIQSTCRDLIAQVVNAFAASLSGLLQMPVNSNDLTPSPAPKISCQFDFVLGALGATVRAAFDQSLLLSIGETVSVTTAESANPRSPFTDLSLRIEALIGQISMPIADVCRWTVGTVFETGQLITDPVDICCNDRVLARGQVVLWQGNYGVKVTSKR